TSADPSQNSATSPAPPAMPPSVVTAANAAPVAAVSASPAAGTAPLEVGFSAASSTDADHDSLTYTWSFGDGGSATGRFANHTYLAAGGFAAVLTVTDGRGGQDTAAVAITAAAPAFPQSTVLDGFDRPDGAPGASWIDETSKFAIGSSALVPTATPAHV